MRTHFYQMSSFDGFEYLEAIENTGGLDILHGKTCYNSLICIYL